MFRKTVLVLAFLIHINGQSEISTCGQLWPSLTPLIRRTYQTHHHWPWHAAIYHKYNETFDPVYQCGGTVISSKHILTAAHCVCIDNMQLDTKIISVSLGRLNLGVNETSDQTFGVAEVIVHPNFNSIDYVNDIAILRLVADITFNQYVQPGCLWKSSKKDISEVIGKAGTVIGWGLTETNKVSNVLRQASMPVVSWGTCLKSKPEVFGLVLSETNFCAGPRNGTSVCQGDSGGSMTFEENGVYYIRGIVSVSPSKENKVTQEVDCDSSQYAIFTDVAKYLEWISDWMAILGCETRVKCRHDELILSQSCSIDVEHSAHQRCKITFDEISNSNVDRLIVEADFDIVPDLTDAVAKFTNIRELHLNGSKLKTVERFKLAAFKSNLADLRLGYNEITQLDANTFDDLKKLVRLDLNDNNLKELHPDLFKELRGLDLLFLFGNQIEILPQGLFRNNRNLRNIDLKNNKIKRIEFDITELQNLQQVDFSDNICINSSCYVYLKCSLSLFNEIIQRSCKD